MSAARDGLTALRQGLARALPWALGAGLLASGLTAWLVARAPDEFQATYGLRLSPLVRESLAAIELGHDPATLAALLLGPRVRAAVLEAPGIAAAFGVQGPDAQRRWQTEYGRRVSVVPAREPLLVFVLCRDDDPARALRLVEQVVSSGRELRRQEIAERATVWRARFDGDEARLRQALVGLERRRDAPRGETPERRAEERLLAALTQARLDDLVALDRRRQSLEALVSGAFEPWSIESAPGAGTEAAPRPRLAPVLSAGGLAAALAALVALARHARRA